MSDRARLSVVVLTKNEEARIARCLESVRWADELIIVDGMSTDRTVEICQQFGARVISHPFEGSFAQERNLGLQHATGDWVLQIDADDVVTEAFRQAVHQLLSTPQPYDAFKFRRKSYLLGKWMRYGGWYHYLPNLVRREAVSYEGAVHERPIVRGPVGVLEVDIEHHPCGDLASFLDRHNRYTTLLAGELARQPHRLTQRAISLQLIRRPWKTFWKSYVKKQGFREGLHGLVFSIFFAGVELIKWAKYWERTREIRVEDVIEPFQSLAVDRERYDRSLLMSHLCAYRLAGQLARQKRVLEIGSGTGYGAFFLAHVAREMLAVDLDQAAAQQARGLFQREHLWYVPMAATRLAVRDGMCDVVGTFQVIEHIPESELLRFVQEIRRVLAPDGVVIISTLNLDHNMKGSPGRYQKASFHEKEFAPHELRALLQQVFPYVSLYGLYPCWPFRLMRRLKKWGMDRWGSGRHNPIVRFYQDLNTSDYCLRPSCTSQAIDLMAICSTRPLERTRISLS